MLDIIVGSKNSNLLRESINAINMMLGGFDVDYHIYKFNSLNSSFERHVNSRDVKIYILDAEIGKEMVALIRKHDFDSIIIIVSSNDKIEKAFLQNGYMILDYIIYNDLYKEKLKSSLNASLKVLYRNEVFVFKYNHVTYRIPFMDIMYIEKETQIKRCLIHTGSNTYHIVASIENLNKLLGVSFVRTHQSCIINLVNVSSVDFIHNVIVFNNGEETKLLTAKNKKIISGLIV